MIPAICIGCGCTDDDACPEGCSWLRLDREDCVGVCSSCPVWTTDWDAGEREPSDEAMDADALRATESIAPGLILPDDAEYHKTLSHLRSR